MSPRAILVLTLLLVLTVTSLGCGSDSKKTVVGPPGDPTAELNAGFTALQNNDIAGANLHFKNALSMSPNNGQANLGVAVTEVALLSEDTDVKELLDLLDSASSNLPVSRTTPLLSPRARALAPVRPDSPRAAALRHVGLPLSSRFDVLSSGRRLFGFMAMSAVTPVQISHLQQIVRTKVLPKLAYVEARLNVIEAQLGFSMLLPTSVTGLTYELEIDTGDILVLDAAVNLVQGTAEMLVSYNADLPDFDNVNVESLFTTSNVEFGTLYPDGGIQLSNARLDWVDAIATMDQAVTSILAETDVQDDDLIMPDTFGTAGDIANLRDQLTRLDDALTGPIFLPFNNSLGAPDSVEVDASAFFTDPPQDLKDFAPDHTFNLLHEFVPNDPLNFPDPTFNGILPGMTNQRLLELFGPPV